MEPARALKHLGFRRRPSKSVCPASAAVRGVCRERASKRWSALLTQTKSRIGHKCGMRKRLGEANWAQFVEYAEKIHKETFFQALTPASGVLRCVGTTTTDRRTRTASWRTCSPTSAAWRPLHA